MGKANPSTESIQTLFICSESRGATRGSQCPRGSKACGTITVGTAEVCFEYLLTRTTCNYQDNRGFVESVFPFLGCILSIDMLLFEGHVTCHAAFNGGGKASSLLILLTCSSTQTAMRSYVDRRSEDSAAGSRAGSQQPQSTSLSPLQTYLSIHNGRQYPSLAHQGVRGPLASTCPASVTDPSKGLHVLSSLLVLDSTQISEPPVPCLGY